ncbi:RIP metalloprotease RseP [bacterium]|nr:RIP metalloprotease RseP [bacterium]
MEVFLIRALQLILCFALLILLHEGGHFLFAKLFKVRVEKFCLFFDPWFTPFKFKPKNSDTTYGIGWLPLGGYVKISGMIDESMDVEQMKQPVKPWEFRAKPAWQRLFIMIGGVLVNFVLAFVIYSAVLFTWGESYIPMKNFTHGFKFNTQAQELGFRDGDILLGTDTKTFEKFEGNVYRDLSEARMAKVLRGNQEVDIPLPGNLNMLEMIKQEPRFVEVLVPAVVDSVVEGTAAAKAGLRQGDRILGFNDTPLTTVNEYNIVSGTMHDILATASPADSARLRNATVIALHPGQEKPDTIRLMLDKEYKMGIVWANPMMKEYQMTTRNYSFLESIPAGFSHGWQVLVGYVDDLKYVFTSDGAKSVGSFVTIGSLFPATWDWCRFWELTAFISLMLAFMNILPIPALDGGHVFFLLCEVITRRKPSDKFMERAQTVGMTLLLLLMALAIFNDFRNFLF